MAVRNENECSAIPLQGALQQIQPVLDALPFYVLLVDSRHNIVAANRKMLQDFQIGSQQLIGSLCPLVVHGRILPISECPLVEALAKGEAVERELYDPEHASWIWAAVFPTLLAGESGEAIFLHFARDITETKKTEQQLSQSLEHHSALCDLLQKFQHCQTSDQILEVLIDKVISLSWLGMRTTGIGFLTKEGQLEMRVHRNLPDGQSKQCKTVGFGECLCGRAAQAGRSILGSSTDAEHTKRYEGMDEHRHVVLPITQEGRVLGVLTLYLKPGNELSSFQLDFLNAAVSAAAAALEGQAAREEVKRVREKSMAQVISYQEDERKRISRELHDQVCQSLSALLLEMQTHGSIDPSLREIRNACESRVRNLIDEVRKMAGQLRPTILDDYGLGMALARHIEELSSKTGLVIDYQHLADEPDKRLPAPVEVSLFRVALEALNNVIRHASASRASVILWVQESKLMLLVEDDGCGFDYAAVRKDLDGCLGIIGMEERIVLMGGTLRIESAPQRGTTVRAEVPIRGGQK